MEVTSCGHWDECDRFNDHNEMGMWISTWAKLMFASKPVKIMMVGLDAAGKTTVLNRFKLGETTMTIPTIGFNVETIEYKNLSFTMWDIGGQKKIRALWKHYFQGNDAIIFVVDSSDRERLCDDQDDRDCVKTELHRLLDDPELQNAALLVIANKQDLPGAMSTSEIISTLELGSIRSRPWYCQGAVASSGEGIYEGLDWLADTIVKRK